MWPALSRLAFAVAVTVAFSAAAQALPFDHLIAGKAQGKLKIDVTADLDAVETALDGTGCRILGKPRMLLMPVDKSNAPTPVNDVPSVTLNAAREDQVFVCYKLRCPASDSLPRGYQDQHASHPSLTFVKGGRLLCVPGVTWNPPCGTPGEEKCIGTCDPGTQCMPHPDDGSCVCVDVPICGGNGPQCGAGHCPDGFTCGSHREEGRCLCLPACEGSPDCEGFCADGAECFNGGNGQCQCILQCGDSELDEPCSARDCVDGKTCVSVGDECQCQ